MKKTFRFLTLGMLLFAGVLSSFAGSRPTDGPADGASVGASVSGGVVVYEVTGWDGTLDAYTVQITGLDYDGLNKEGGVTELTVQTSFSEKWKTTKYKYYVEKIIDTDATQKKAFYAATKLTKLVFQADDKNAVKTSDFTFSVGNYAFYGCTKLATLTLPDNVKSIGKYAFQNTAITTFTIPAKCVTIGQNAFYNTQKLETVNVSKAGNSVMTVLGPQVFCNSYVQDLNLENATALTAIDDKAFIYDKSDVNYQLKTVTLPKAAPTPLLSDDLHYNHFVSNFTTIGTAFANLTGLTEIKNLEVSQVANVDDGAFENCSSLTALNFPYVANLNHSTKSPFLGCKKLATLTFADGWMGTIASNLYISAGLTKEEQAAELSYLKNIVFNVKGDDDHYLSGVFGTISASAFGNADAKLACSGLTSVVFNNTISNGAAIGVSAFQNCAALNALKFNGFKAYFKYAKNVTEIPAGTITIDGNAFKGTALTAVDFKTINLLPEANKSEMTIAAGAFACDQLASVTFGNIKFAKSAGNSLTINDGAFVSDLLKNVTFAKIIAADATGKLTIGNGITPVFAATDANPNGVLETVTFGQITAGDFTINNKAFRSELLKTVVLAANEEKAADKVINIFNKLTINDEAFGFVKDPKADSHANEKTVTIAEIKGAGTITIGDAAFFGDKLTTVKIGAIAATATIGTAAADATKGAFGGNDAAKTVEINGLLANGSNVITINKYAFYGDKLQSVLIGTVDADSKVVPALISAPSVSINDYAFAGKELTSVTMGDITSATSATIAQYAFANVSNVADKVAYDMDVTIGKLNSSVLNINANAFQGPQYDGSTFDVVIGNVDKAATIAAGAFVAPATGASSYTFGDIAAGTFANVGDGSNAAFVGSKDAEKNTNSDVTTGKLGADMKAYVFNNIKKLSVLSWDAANNFHRFIGTRVLEIRATDKDGKFVDGLGLNAALWGDGGLNTVEEIYIGGDVATAGSINSFGKKVRKVMFTKNNAKVPAGIVNTGAFTDASNDAADKETIVVRYYVDEENAILSNQIFDVDAFGSDDSYTNVDLYCSDWQKANTFENVEIIGSPDHIYRMQYSSSNVIPGENIVASATVQNGGKYAYGRLFVPAGTSNYYKIDAKKVGNTNTVNVFSATVDGADIYMKSLDIQDGYFWIDASAADQAFIIRTSNIDGADADNKVEITVESVGADEKDDFEANGGYFFDASDAKKNALKYAKETIIKTELQNSTVFNTKDIYVMLNPKSNGLKFGLLNPATKDLSQGMLYVLCKKSASAAPELNVIFEDEVDADFTGITNVEKKAENGEMFNLQGVRVSNAQKGLYIQNGKKFIVK